jgi:hypothetical protein
MNAYATTQSEIGVKPIFTPAMSGLLQRACACGQHSGNGGECAECKKKREGTLQRAAVNFAPTQGVPPIVNSVLQAPGRPLDAPTRAFMEPRFGRDLSNVRVHTDGPAADSARAVNALAYTMGNQVVFGAGQYAPTTSAGRRLLAHELAHTVQQASSTTGLQTQLTVGAIDTPAEREAEHVAARVTDQTSAARISEFKPVQQSTSTSLLQRVPAAPSYNGVTGTIDLSKLRFTPIPDFKAGDLTSPLTLTPTLVDSSLVHLSWELYDPSDKLIDGFSTLPGHSISKSASFELKPDLFKAGKAATGRYTLRLVGRNAAHEPVAYFERYFFVLAADLTTGTAATGALGDFTFTEYGKTDGDFAKGIDYVVDIKLNFMPKANAITCDNIGFLQVLESSDRTGKSNHRFAGARKEARKTPLNYSVDRAESGPSPFYGTFKNPTTGAIVPGSNFKPGKGGSAPVAAELEDHPTWNQATVDRFETCATCRSGANAGQIYGCVTWGFSVDATGKVTLMPRSLKANASDTLKPAVANWNVWRAAQPKPTDFEAAPTLK